MSQEIKAVSKAYIWVASQVSWILCNNRVQIPFFGNVLYISYCIGKGRFTWICIVKMMLRRPARLWGGSCRFCGILLRRTRMFLPPPPALQVLSHHHHPSHHLSHNNWWSLKVQLSGQKLSEFYMDDFFNIYFQNFIMNFRSFCKK